MSARDGWRRARLESVLELTQAFSRPRREAEVVDELVQRSVALLDARAGIGVSLSANLVPLSIATVGWPDDYDRAAQLVASPGLSAVREGGVVTTSGRDLDVPFTEVLAAPCLWYDELLAVVMVADREALGGGRGRFDEEDVSFLRSLALLAAPALSSRRALETAERERIALEEENRALRAEIGDDVDIVGQSPAFRRVLELVRRVAPSDVSVLVRGESGTGKERISRLVHALSPRQAAPFVPLNCAAVPETLLEAELFGIEGGVATGVTARPGKFELADGGTLFLDEIGDLSPSLQAKLLRVLQDREVERVGGRTRKRVDVRLVTATNRDLEVMMVDGAFRADLYYRLRVVELRVPPLRERREDIPLLCRHFLRAIGRRRGLGDVLLSRGALEEILAHEFPGNVRELENLLEASAALASGPRIEREDVRLAFGRGGDAPAAATGTLDEVMRVHVQRTVERCGGNRSAAARALGIDRSTLYRMLVRWNATGGANSTKSPEMPSGGSLSGGGRR